MIWNRSLSMFREILLVMWLSTVFASAFPSSDNFPTFAEAEEDFNHAGPQTSRDLQRLQSLLTLPGLVIEYKRLINTPIDLSMEKRYGFAGLDNLDVIHRVLDSRQPDNVAVNRESKFSIRELMARHG